MRIGGIATGLDTEGLVRQLMDLERFPLLRLQQKKDVLQWRKEALLDFRTKLQALQSRASALTLDSAFSVKKTTTSDDKVATVSASSAAVNGSYSLEVSQLASATRVTSTGAIGLPAGTYASLTSSAEMNAGVGIDADPNASFSGGTAATRLESEVVVGSFKINNITITVSADDTINMVLNKINDSSAGVKATLSGDKITLTQKTMGATPTITVGEDTSGFLAAAKLSSATVVAGTDPGEVRKLADTGLGFTSGYFTINDYTFSVDTATESLNDIINKINNSSAGVTAFYDKETDLLTLTSKTTGNDLIALGRTTDTSNFLTTAKVDGAVQTAGNLATFKLNGVHMTRDSNSFDVNGITFNLKNAGNATISVAQDTDAIVKNVEDFVTEYNSVMEWINSKLTEKTIKEPITTVDKKSGILRTDSTLRRMQTYLRTTVFNPVNGLPAEYNQLADIGITTGAADNDASTALNSKLQLDKDKLKAALAADPNAVANLFSKGTVSVSNEVHTADGTTSLYLNNTPVSYDPEVSLTVNGTAYKLVADPQNADEFKIDYSTGLITFHTAPANGAEIKATYDYMVSSGAEAGIAVNLKNYVGEVTGATGELMKKAGGSGSINTQIKDLEEDIKNFEYRLELKEDRLWRQFSQLETIMSSFQNQSAWLNGQLAQLGGWV